MRALLAALLLDAFIGEPPGALHPVVWMGRTLTFLEQRAPGSARVQLVYGGLVGTGLPLAWGMLGLLLERTLPWPLQALALKPAFAGRALLSAAERVEHDLCVGDLSQARTALKSLVSRPTVQLDDTLVAAAAIESLAENLVDSYVAPLAMYAAFGLGGAYAYRAANTADAMWGYRTPEYEWLGKAAARLDDALNWFPARLGAVLLVLVGPQRRRAWRIWRRDAPLTTSPNAGQPMAACAGQLGVRLEKLEHYVLYAEGRPPTGGDMAAARGVVARAMFWTAVAMLLVRGVTRAAPRRGGRPQ